MISCIFPTDIESAPAWDIQSQDVLWRRFPIGDFPRADDRCCWAGHICDVQQAHNVHGDLACLLLVFFGTKGSIVMYSGEDEFRTQILFVVWVMFVRKEKCVGVLSRGTSKSSCRSRSMRYEAVCARSRIWNLSVQCLERRGGCSQLWPEIVEEGRLQPNDLVVHAI